MNTIQQGIVTLLRSAITGEQLPLPEGFEIQALPDYAKQHSMYTLIYAGAANCGVHRKDPAMVQLFQAYMKVLLRSEEQMRDLERMLSAFDAHGIEYMPLKGCRMKSLYPRQELRIMGDADVLIRMEQYEKIVPIMESLGFRDDGESDHELKWRTPALFVELHKRLIPSYNKDFYAYFGDGWQLGKRKDGTRYSMTPEDEMVYLFTHFAKHYRDGGIGCRHVVDLWVYRRENPDLDENYVRSALKKLQLVEFYDNILELIAVWFADAPSNDKMDFMTEFIFASGSWGKMENRTLSMAVRDGDQSILGGSGKLLYIWKTLFPGVEMLRDKYTVLKKAPWLLPVVWLIRPFYKVLFERKSLNRHKQNLEALTEENVDQRRQALQYVGLDYNF